MTEAGLFTALVLGFTLGMQHALDADHIVAVSTIVSKSGNWLKSATVGAVWGVGHTSTLFVVGGIVLALRLTIPETLALTMEFAVGVVLVVLGASLVREFVARRIHLHFHKHEDQSHLHAHRHTVGEGHKHEHSHVYKSLLIGMIHGLAGSAALMLLVLTTIGSIWEGLFFILVFGTGSILGMLVFSGVIGLPFVFTARYANQLNQGLRLAAGMLSMGLGLVVLWEIGIVEGLFLRL
ncbi:MAG: sulfite exporter TauE/SafE family protein [Chloroflexi bacterium]|nr:sulfite exporter TauE/SafE family protein [Chloroflexota bacterium]